MKTSRGKERGREAVRRIRSDPSAVKALIRVVQANSERLKFAVQGKQFPDDIDVATWSGGSITSIVDKLRNRGSGRRKQIEIVARALKGSRQEQLKTNDRRLLAEGIIEYFGQFRRT